MDRRQGLHVQCAIKVVHRSSGDPILDAEHLAFELLTGFQSSLPLWRTGFVLGVPDWHIVRDVAGLASVEIVLDWCFDQFLLEHQVGLASQLVVGLPDHQEPGVAHGLLVVDDMELPRLVLVELLSDKHEVSDLQVLLNSPLL